MATVTIDSSNFQSDVLGSSEPVVVDFWAEWCGPCKMISPALEEISSEMEGKVKIAKVNVDENQDLAVQFGVRSIPDAADVQGRPDRRPDDRRRAQGAPDGLDQKRRRLIRRETAENR